MLLLNIVLIVVIDGVEDCSVLVKGVIDDTEVRLLADVALIVVTDGVMLSSSLDVALVNVTDDVIISSSLLDKVFIKLIENVEDNLLLVTALINIVDIDGVIIILLLEVTFVEETDGVEVNEATLLTVIDVAEVITALFDISLVDVMEDAVGEVANNELFTSLLDITLVDVTDDDSSLLDKVLMEATDNVEDSSLLDTLLLTVADGAVIIPLLEMVETDGVEISILLKATLVIVTVAAEVITALLDITLVDVRDKEGAGADNVVVDTELVNIIDVEEYCSLCDLALVGRADITEFISLSVAVLKEATVCTELS